jgi:hypothetical protein
MMVDIVLDTDILADLLTQYYENDLQFNGYFESKERLNQNLVRKLNTILRWYYEEDDGSYPGLIVASSLAFVEIARKFDEIINQRITLEQFAVFIEQPPEWFLISAVDNTLLPYLCNLPREISLPNGDVKPIEWADAIHIATAMSRDEPWLLAVTDASIKAVEILKDKVV